MNDFFTSEEKKELFSLYRHLMQSAGDSISWKDCQKLKNHLIKAAQYNGLQRNNFGMNPVIKDLQTAVIVAEEIGMKGSCLIGIMLHEIVKTHILSIDEVSVEYGEDVASIIKGLVKTNELYAKSPAIESENFRNLLLSFAEDMRVILIMIADRVNVMRQIKDTGNEEDRIKVANEAAYLYAPLAHKLGLYKLKSELEDLSLKYTQRDTYYFIKDKLNETKASRDKYIAAFIEPIKKKVTEAGLKFDIKGRTKSIHSIWNKIQKQKTPFEGIYDLFAIRIILDSEPDPAKEKQECWQVYSIVTDMYQPNPKRLRDWLSIPKSNGYESLHITVMGPEGKWVEVQIRTERMDEIAEKGFAAHWKYKGGTADKAIEEWLTELREILESSEVGAVDMLDDIKINLQDKEVHVFTPAGDLKTLPAGATLLDFAYAIHTAVGSRCVGGKVNQRNETLRYVLKNGDQVSILTSNNQQPNADWLNIATTSKARNKIRQFLTEDSRAQATLGKEMLARRFKNWKLELTDEVIHRLQQHYKYKFAIDLYQAIAEEKLDMAEIKEFITRPKEEERTVATPREEVQVIPSRPISEDVLLIDRNVDNVVYKFARCCNPVFGDDILGFVSIGEGIKIHRTQCKNALDLQRRYPYRIVQAAWTNAGATSYQTVLSIVGREDAGMVTKITEVIAKDPKITLRGLSINSSEGLFDGQITVLVSDTEHLSQLISRLKRIQGVMRVYRHDSVKE